MVAVLSQYIAIDPCCFFLIPSNTLLNHTAWHVADVDATYFSYADKSVTIGSLDAHEITPKTRWNT